MNNKSFPFEGKILDGGKCICDICGLTLKEAKYRREQMFASSNLFTKLKMEDYFKLKGGKLDSLEEGNMILSKIMDFWNNKFTTRQRISFEEMKDEDLKEIYGKAEIDFSDLLRIKSAKIERNDPCFCGSGKKYKKCCGMNK